jgi:hypothetical protein
MKLRVLLFAIPALLPLLLETVHGRTSGGAGRLAAVALVRLAAADPVAAPAAVTRPMALVALIASPPITGQGEPRSAATQSADRRYDILLRHSAWFRELRETRECTPIDEAELQQTCRRSFGSLQALPADQIRQALAAR